MEKHPFDKLLHQIAEIMQYAYDHAHKPISEAKAVEADKKLDEIEKQIKDFKAITEQALGEDNLTDYTYEAMMEDETHEKVSPEERAILLRAEFLKSQASEASKNVVKAAKEMQESGKRLTDPPKKGKKAASAKARKGKFKSMGGYKNWKPL